MVMGAFSAGILVVAIAVDETAGLTAAVAALSVSVVASTVMLADHRSGHRLPRSAAWALGVVGMASISALYVVAQALVSTTGSDLLLLSSLLVGIPGLPTILYVCELHAIAQHDRLKRPVAILQDGSESHEVEVRTSDGDLLDSWAIGAVSADLPTVIAARTALRERRWVPVGAWVPHADGSLRQRVELTARSRRA
ncbi:hypothetical protein CBI38_37235 (plasmid) [Rhodococcus oxybenzonivorans]|uniref:Uncharacterized protein n=1 Tax=Rhodococcus oxybenzonivorans TaxID=1990687 RepID=A0A2S2C842_9NOCA|nr:hypothetical protein CBI38_37235 [Rhodococcus oxybenzonivorans]